MGRGEEVHPKPSWAMGLCFGKHSLSRAELGLGWGVCGNIEQGFKIRSIVMQNPLQNSERRHQAEKGHLFASHRVPVVCRIEPWNGKGGRKNHGGKIRKGLSVSIQQNTGQHVHMRGLPMEEREPSKRLNLKVPDLTQDWELCLVPLARMEKLSFTGIVQKTQRSLASAVGSNYPRPNTFVVLTNKS